MSDRRTIAGNHFKDGTRIHQGDINNYQNCSHNDKKRCLSDLRITDPRDDKARIEQSKGGLLKDSYRWILDHDDFQRWKKPESDSRFLWIRGDPGKGKTMLLAGIIDELVNEPGNFSQVAYFFCQETDSRINNATAVLRGLIYMLVISQESLLVHVWKEYEHAGKQLFEDRNAFTALSRILNAILADSDLREAVLIIDALDECVMDLQLLLALLVELSQHKVRWIVSSRNWPEIDVLHDAAQKFVLYLELNEASISQAVKAFISYKVDSLVKRKSLSAVTRVASQEYMESNCNETFLWVALAIQLIEDPKLPAWKILSKLRETPAGLDNMYRRMLHYTLDSYCMEDCKQILKLAISAYRPLTLDEMLSLWQPSEDTPFDKHTLQQIVKRAGSFLILRDDIVSFIHQSAKDYLIAEAIEELSLDGHLQHCHVFDRCLIALNLNLRRNIYSLDYPGFPIEKVKSPQPDPLAPVRYCIIYWASHLCDSGPSGLIVASESGTSLEEFLRERILNWIEAVCLMQLLPDALRAVKRLENLLTTTTEHCLPSVSQEARRGLQDSINNVFRMLCYFKPAIEAAPLQIYASGLTFCPQIFLDSVSETRSDAHDGAYKWKVSSLDLLPQWSPRIQTFAFPANCEHVYLAATQDGFIICSWQYNSLTIQMTNNAAPVELLGHPSDVVLGVYSTDCTRLACLSAESKIVIWDLEKKNLLRTLQVDIHECFDASKMRQASRDGNIALTFTRNNSTLLLAYGGRIKSWSANDEVPSQRCGVEKLSGNKFHMFGRDGTRLATFEEGTVEIRDLDTYRIIWRCGNLEPIPLEGGRLPLTFSCDGNKFAIVENDRMIVHDLKNGEDLYIDAKLRTSGLCAATPIFTRSGKIGVPCVDGIHLWAIDGTFLGTWAVEVGANLCFSADETQIAAVDSKSNVVIWDAALSAKADRDAKQYHPIDRCFISSNGCQLATVTNDTITTWDTQSGALVQSFEIQGLRSVRFSSDLRWLAWTENDGLIRFWDTLVGRVAIEVPCPDADIESPGRLSFSYPDFNLVAIWSPDGEIAIWDLLSRSRKPHVWRAQRPKRGHDSAHPFVFSLLKTEFFLSHPENGIEVYDINTGALRRTFELPHRSPDGVKPCCILSLSDDGLRLVARRSVNNCSILDAKTGVCLTQVSIDFSDPQFADRRVRTKYGVLDLHNGRLMQARSHEVVNDWFRIAGSIKKPNDYWVMCGKKRMIWIPPEFRVFGPRVVGNTVICRDERGGLVSLRFF